MNEKLHRFFRRNNAAMIDLMYILRSGRKTAFHLVDGRVIENYMHLKDLVILLPEEDFCRINKSIIVARRHILSIQNNIYTMADGRELEGRIRTPGAHSTIMHELEQSHASQAAPLLSEEVRQRFSLLDHLPIPFCVVEVAINDDQSGMNLVFCYGNNAMFAHEKRIADEIIGHSFFELYPAHINAKWIAIHTDVALNGTTHMIRDYDEERNMHFTFHCFQPAPGYSASVLVNHEFYPNP